MEQDHRDKDQGQAGEWVPAEQAEELHLPLVGVWALAVAKVGVWVLVVAGWVAVRTASK